MRSALFAAALAALGLALAGCGGSGSAKGGATPRAAIPASRSHPTQVYRLQLSGAAEVPPGAANGQGAAIIAFHGDSLLCWRFAHLHGFTDATSAHIQVGTTRRLGRAVIALGAGPRLHHQGCVSVTPALSRRIWARPSGYYVNVHSRRYPQGAVRAQL